MLREGKLNVDMLNGSSVCVSSFITRNKWRCTCSGAGRSVCSFFFEL